MLTVQSSKSKIILFLRRFSTLNSIIKQARLLTWHVTFVICMHHEIDNLVLIFVYVHWVVSVPAQYRLSWIILLLRRLITIENHLIILILHYELFILWVDLSGMLVVLFTHSIISVLVIIPLLLIASLRLHSKPCTLLSILNLSVIVIVEDLIVVYVQLAGFV